MGLLAGALVLSVASGSKGDRAEAGHCPEGEVCSSDTPDGLYFRGPGFADTFLDYDVRPTAVGGRQTIDIDPVGLFHDLESFDAETTDPALEVTGVNEPAVTLAGISTGSAYLRIFEPNTGALYDRLMVSAVEVTALELAPLIFETEFPDDGLNEPLYWGADDTALPWIARVYGDSTRLVDENLTFGGSGTGTANAAVGTTGLWDLAEVTPVGAAATITVGAQSGSGVTGAASVDMAYTVGFILESETSPAPETHDASNLFSACFAAYDGNRRILGIPWEYTLTGPNGEEPESISAVLLGGNCVQARASAAGDWQLDVTAGDVTESYIITMTPPAPAPPAPAPAPPPSPAPLPDATPGSPDLMPQVAGTPGWRAHRALPQLATPAP